MQQTQLIEAIKINARTTIDTINRAVEVACSKAQTGVPMPATELAQMNDVLENFREAAEQLEVGANALGHGPEKVA